MIGAIIGDVIGSRFEFNNIKTKEFDLFGKGCTFTDDTVTTCAIANALMRCTDDYEELSRVTTEELVTMGRKYPNCGFGGRFGMWVFADEQKPYNSFGNGSAMRISPVGDIARNTREVEDLSYAVTSVTHNHPEGLKGAEATARAIFMARHKDIIGASKRDINKRSFYHFGYEIDTVDNYRKRIHGHGDETCMVSLPQAFACFLEGKDYEDVIRNCISIGGDCDTTGAIAGGIAEAFFGVPEDIKKEAENYIDDYLLNVVYDFEKFRFQGAV